MFKYFILFLVLLNVALFSYNKGHDDGYFDGATDAFFGNLTPEENCLRYKKCSDQIKKKKKNL